MTHTCTRHFVCRHRTAVAVALIGFLLGVIVHSAGGHLGAHFLQRPVQVKVTEKLPVRRIIRVQEPQTADTALSRRQLRLAARRKAQAGSAMRKPAAPRLIAMDGTSHAAAGIEITDTADFPAFGYAVHPVAAVPDWGDMHSPAVWNRTYSEMHEEDFVPVPAYDLSTLTIPLSSLVNPFSEQNVPAITAKLYYSTRFLGSYDVDAGDYSGRHAGIDLKLPEGTPVGAVAGGRVHAVRTTDILGLHVIIEHRHPLDGTFFSVYGHLETVAVAAGDVVGPGQTIGVVGMTGKTTGPHLHLQIDRARGDGKHIPYAPPAEAGRAEWEQWTVHPVEFIDSHATQTFTLKSGPRAGAVVRR